MYTWYDFMVTQSGRNWHSVLLGSFETPSCYSSNECDIWAIFLCSPGNKNLLQEDNASEMAQQLDDVGSPQGMNRQAQFPAPGCPWKCSWSRSANSHVWYLPVNAEDCTATNNISQLSFSRCFAFRRKRLISSLYKAHAVSSEHYNHPCHDWASKFPPWWKRFREQVVWGEMTICISTSSSAFRLVVQRLFEFWIQRKGRTRFPELAQALLIQDSTAGWNSAFYMMKWLLQLRHVLSTVTFWLNGSRFLFVFGPCGSLS